MKKEDFAKIYWDNYTNVSEVALWADGFLKETFNGRGSYIPWSVMTTALMRLDPDSKVEKIENSSGGFVFSDIIEITTTNRTMDKGVETSTVTSVDSMAHYVKIKVTFLGRETLEVYPILDKAHQSTKTINTQDVNKALQRAVARAISIATGVGLSLWTTEDFAIQELEGDIKTDAPIVKPPLPKTTPKADKKSVEEPKSSDPTDLLNVIPDDQLDMTKIVSDADRVVMLLNAKIKAGDPKVANYVKMINATLKQSGSETELDLENDTHDVTAGKIEGMKTLPAILKVLGG